MFFRNAQLKQETFEDHLAKMKQAGFEVQKQSGGAARVTRGGDGAIVEDAGGGKVKLGKAGVLVGGEIALLISGGYQMFLRTPSARNCRRWLRSSRRCMPSTKTCAKPWA